MHRADALDAARDWIKTKVACDATPAGLQIVLPGAETVPQGVLAQRRADAPIKPAKPQQPCDVGLFSDEADQLDLCEMFQDSTEEE
jgi:hypothetical protein